MPMCTECEKGRYMTVMAPAAKCGHMTTRGSMELCSPCSERENACEACGLALPVEPPPHTD